MISQEDNRRGSGFLGSLRLRELSEEEQDAIMRNRDAPDFKAPKGEAAFRVKAGEQ